MPNIQSATKRMRQNEKRRAANRSARSALRTSIKKVEQSVVAGDVKQAEQSLGQALKMIGKSAKKGLIHDNTASRHASRLTKKINALQKNQ